MANGKKKPEGLKSLLVLALNKSMAPVEYGYLALRKGVKYVRNSAPSVYREFEHVIKANTIPIDKAKQIFRRKNMEGVWDAITSGVIGRMHAHNIDHDALKKIVKSKSSQTFIDMLAKGLSTSPNEKEYTLLAKEKQFKKVLIANRGEIVLRVIRACRELGIATATVYSKHDKNNLAAKFAGEAYYLGPSSSYLDMAKIIAIAKKIGADAIHPGYGFLAENPKFAKMCIKNSIKFIGPSPRALALLGDKVMAKKTASKAGVPIIIGMMKPLRSKRHALKLARKIGFPVIIKAAAGGGGKGMRIVRREEDIGKSYGGAEAEAMLSFKDKTLYMEKYIEDPRHIEFQILADQHGNVIHLGERDCSVQRKHQKLIEESPSPALSDELREKMGAAAVKVIATAKYEGAGTVEFLLDKNKNFYFIEVNTRIQVEHGVTEIVTGVDLVKEQIKIASGSKIAFKQSDISFNGCAIECRINAEDPLADFAPSIGTITNYLPPGGPGIRLNSVCHQGYRVSPHYDSLLALLICYGGTRGEALARMAGALKEYAIEGVKTTIPFHLAVLSNKNFARGRATTSFIEKNNILNDVQDYYFDRKKALAKEERIILVTTAVSKYMESRPRSQGNKPSPWVAAGRQELMEQN